jgi:hypothetical protein
LCAASLGGEGLPKHRELGRIVVVMETDGAGDARREVASEARKCFLLGGGRSVNNRKKIGSFLRSRLGDLGGCFRLCQEGDSRRVGRARCLLALVRGDALSGHIAKAILGVTEGEVGLLGRLQSQFFLADVCTFFAGRERIEASCRGSERLRACGHLVVVGGELCDERRLLPLKERQLFLCPGDLFVEIMHASDGSHERLGGGREGRQQGGCMELFFEGAPFGVEAPKGRFRRIAPFLPVFCLRSSVLLFVDELLPEATVGGLASEELFCSEQLRQGRF